MAAPQGQLPVYYPSPQVYWPCPPGLYPENSLDPFLLNTLSVSGTSAIELARRDPALRSKDAKIMAALSLLADARTTPAELVADIAQAPATGHYLSLKRSGLLKKRALDYLWNTLSNLPSWNRKVTAMLRLRAVRYVIDMVDREMQTELFRMSSLTVNTQYLQAFDLGNLTRSVKTSLPVAWELVTSIIQHRRVRTDDLSKKTEAVSTALISQISHLRSQNNMVFQVPFGLMLLSLGLPTRAFNIFAAVGLCPAYSTLRTTYQALSDERIALAREVALGIHGIQWDNVHISTSAHPTQRDMARGKVSTGTQGILCPLPHVPHSVAYSLNEHLARRASLDLIDYKFDIRTDLEQGIDISYHLVIDTVKILRDSAGNAFDYLGDPDELRHHSYLPLPAGEKADQYSLPTTTIDESTTVGNIEFPNVTYTVQLKISPTHFEGLNIPLNADQSTLARLRSAMELRAGDLNAFHRLEVFQLSPGPFHILLNLGWQNIAVHRGDYRDPGSLAWCINILRLSRLGGDKPDYKLMCTLFIQVLQANLLVYWEVETGKTIRELADAKLSASELFSIGRRIYLKYFSDDAIQRLGEGLEVDQAFKDVILLNRDLLVFYELSLGVSSGDFGRIELFLGILTEGFAGAGRFNYMTEMLHLLQNLKKIWIPQFADVMRHFMLINMSGRPNHATGRDMDIEHLINAMKAYYIPKGVRGHWGQLSTYATLIPVLRPLKFQFTKFFNTCWMGTTHTEPDTSRNVARLMRKIYETRIHIPIPGRTTHAQTVDVISAGIDYLMKTGLPSWQKSFREWVRTNHYNFEDREPEPVHPDEDLTSGGVEDLPAGNESKEDDDSESESVHSDIDDTESRGGNDGVDADMETPESPEVDEDFDEIAL
ncbi:hypothetical protein CONPUDRAFT_152236 [Coniophora puteana RWD-64-598 SS2]|uniref:DUF6589 domain-containing protein n=1 Tax=Coniophora puteana (strain RWD-64-598) TaxID=741705 RepID=A0A5M3MVX2_CONPW|nr:uncharacterized protein CONPUDRAFT_152236 [Coniophora puteana RWD-64-598 SS2]EIW83200.1 hypothetical protein CONPUDRAFT_152236 [Coniophora puteana RWD-64-598 SS2]